MATLSTSAWVLHDLGLAAGFGVPLFGKIALSKAVRDIPSEIDRGKVLNEASNSYNIINGVALGTAALSWFFGRTMVSGKSIDRTTHQLVIAKDILMGASVLTGALNMVGGMMLDRQAPGGEVPMESEDVPSPRASRNVAFLQRFTGVMGPLNLVLTAGVIGVTTILAMKSGKSTRWGFLAKLRP